MNVLHVLQTCLHFAETAALAGMSVSSFHALAQFMPGGDLGSALRRDMVENGDGAKRRLGWYGRGRIVLLCIARGLVYLHDQRVRPLLSCHIRIAMVCWSMPCHRQDGRHNIEPICSWYTTT